MIPKTSEQNGEAERKNRSLVESVRSMRSHHISSGEKRCERLFTSTNRSSTKGVQKMSPYEASRDKWPTVKHLRIFGCTPLAHVPKDEKISWIQKQAIASFLVMELKLKPTGRMTQNEEECSTRGM